MSDALTGYLAIWAARVTALEASAVADEPDAVHQMRVATRRLRSALTSFRPLLRREITEPLRLELQWLGVTLGQPRDAEVLRARFAADSGPAGQELDRVLGERHRLTHAQFVEAVRGSRYAALRGALGGVGDHPPVRKRARHRSQAKLATLVGKACARVDRAAVLAAATPNDDLLHEVRKAAKRARYAAEVAAPAFGPPASGLARALAGLQEVLGEHQDSVVAREFLALHVGDLTGEGYLALLAKERERAAAAERDWPAALAGTQPERLRAWTGSARS